MIVSTAKTDDLPQLLELVAEYQSENEEHEAQSVEQNSAYLTEVLGNDRFGIIFIGKTSSGAPVGFIHLALKPVTIEARHVPHVLDLFVKPNHREKGFGKLLFEHAVKWAKKHKHTRVECTVESMNMVAQYLFDHFHADSDGRIAYSIDLTKE